jgi:hypothetical protein
MPLDVPKDDPTGIFHDAVEDETAEDENLPQPRMLIAH